MKSQQLDIRWTEPEAFALVVQQTSDGDRIAAERTESVANQQASEKYQMTLSKLLQTRRWCYTIVETQDPALHGGYVPSLVIEGDKGHRPMIGRDNAPWVWGKTLDDAQATCRAYNEEQLGISEEEQTRIVLSTL